MPHEALGVNFIWQPSLGKIVAMILNRRSEAAGKYEHLMYSLDLFTQGGLAVLPVPHGGGMSDDEGDIHHCVLNTDAPVGSASEDEVVSGVGLSRTVWIQPTGGVELFRVAVDLGILERVVEGRDDHAVGRNGVIIGDGEGAGSFIGNL